MSLIKQDYIEWFEQIKQKIKIAQLKISLSANAQLLQAYWELGDAITRKQQESNWAMPFWSNFLLIYA